ncbi:MAG: hypothetical protein ABI811_05185 [Acidobacteriota bacterium]
MKQLLPTMIVLSGFLMPIVARAENVFAAVTAQPPAGRSVYSAESNTRAMRAWKRSLVPVVATQGLDIASSYGMRELNPMLAGRDGRFGGKAASIKIGSTAAAIGIEYLLVKKWPGAARMFAKLNWGSSAVTGALAAHNYAIK